MDNLIKIKDVSDRYDVTARTLRYYEDMGLISSVRGNDYAYRMYDEDTIKRIEQILILRKLNISVKDIRRIFDAPNSAVVLEVLGAKVRNIDDEVALLHELKDIILDFIREIERVDFTENSCIRLLYDKAKEIETQLVSVDYIGKPSNISRLLEVTESLRKPPEVRIVEVKPFRAIVNKPAPMHIVFGENSILEWRNKNNNLLLNPVIGSLEFFSMICPNDFAFCPNCGEKCEMKGQFIIGVEECVTAADATPFEVIDFKGGLYAVVMSVDEDDEMHGNVNDAIQKWLETSGFELDKARHGMSTMVSPSDEMKIALGYNQLDIYEPVKIRDNAADLKINPYPVIPLWSPGDRQIVSLPDENRSNVIKIANPKNWAVVSHNLEQYKGKKITLTFSAEVKRVGAAGRLNWAVNNSDYPSVGTIDNAPANVWHKTGGTWTGTLTAEHPSLFLDTWKNNSDNTVYYIDKFKIDIV